MHPSLLAVLFFYLTESSKLTKAQKSNVNNLKIERKKFINSLCGYDFQCDESLGLACINMLCQCSNLSFSYWDRNLLKCGMIYYKYYFIFFIIVTPIYLFPQVPKLGFGQRCSNDFQCLDGLICHPDSRNCDCQYDYYYTQYYNSTTGKCGINIE